MAAVEIGRGDGNHVREKKALWMDMESESSLLTKTLGAELSWRPNWIQKDMLCKRLVMVEQD